MNSETFVKAPSKVCSFTTSVAPPLATAPSVIRACICICIAANYFCCYLIITFKSCWLIALYGGGGDSDGDIGVSSGRIGKDDWWAKRTNPALDSVSDSYSNNKIFVDNSKHSSCPTYTIYWLLIYFSTNYCPKEFLTNIPKKEISTLDISLLDNVITLCGQITRGPIAQAYY